MSMPSAPARQGRRPAIVRGGGDGHIGDANGARASSMPRLVVVSNRVSVPDPEGPRQAGGLVVAVDAALRRRDGIWFGWSGKIAEGAASAEPRTVERRSRTVVTLDLSSVDFQEYY